MDLDNTGFGVKLVMTTRRRSPFAVSTSNCLMLESLSSIHTFAVVNAVFDRLGTRVTMCVERPPMIAVPADATVKRVRGEFKNWSAGSTVLALPPV